MEEISGKWANEVYKDTALSYEISKKLYGKRSKFQMVEVYKTKKHGNLMALDGCFMLTEKEEFVYHEMIVHIPLFSHPNPEKVLVIGGGDGGTVREILKHKAVKKIDFVEIDYDVYKVSLKYFKTLTDPIKNNKKVNFLFGDGIKFVSETSNKYDIILIDSTDPSDISGGLFGTQFFKNIHRVLDKNGIMVSQSEDPFFDGHIIKNVHLRLKKIFKYVKLYLAFIPTYPSGCWSFTYASNSFTPDVIRNKFSKKFKTKYYNYELHKAAFVLPEFVRGFIK